jgi:hypothetical protein
MEPGRSRICIETMSYRQAGKCQGSHRRFPHKEAYLGI